MKQWLASCAMLLVMPISTWAGQRCTQVSTGKLLEYQSEARPGTCTANAISQGYLASDIKEQSMTSPEWLAYREEHIDKPAREQQQKEQPVEIPLSQFGGLAGGLAGAASLIIVARKKKEGA